MIRRVKKEKAFVSLDLKNVKCAYNKIVPISEVVPNPRNPNKHSDTQIELLAKIIYQQGFRAPITVSNRSGFIVRGHGRLMAAQKLSLTEVPVDFQDYESDALEKADLLADNKIAEFAFLEVSLVTPLVQELDSVGFDLDLTAFGRDEIEAFLEKDITKSDLKVDNEILDEIKDLDDLAPTDEEWKELEGKIPIIEFSGGKDSSATVVWALHFLKIKPVLVYCSIGVDHPSLWQHLFDCAKFFECEFKILNSPISFFDVLNQKGWPGFKFPWCLDLMHKTTDEFMLKNYDPGSFVVLRGGRNQEKIRRDNVKKERLMVIQRVLWKFYHPFAFCSKKVCEEVLFSSDVPLWSGYNYGLDRTACWICPGQRTTTYAALRRNYPDLWESLLKWEGLLGHGAWQNTKAFNVMADSGAAKLNKSCCLKRPVKRIF